MGQSKRTKQAKRKAQVARKRRYAELQARMRAFPDVVIVPGCAPPALVAAVAAAAKDVRRNHQRLLPPYFHRLFVEARQVGFPAALSAFRRDFESGVKQAEDVTRFRCCLGELLQERVPPALLTSYLPFHCMDVTYGEPVPAAIQVSFRSLEQAKGPGGTVYFSRHRPTLVSRGEARVVAFSTHALQQTCARTVAEWQSYGGSGDAFAFFDQCVYFEDCSRQFGGPAFTFYNCCHPEFFTGAYAQILRRGPEPPPDCYYRVGYCPAVLEGGFIKAKTLLIPGMRGTPEHAVLSRSSLPQATKEAMLRDVESLTYARLAQTRDFHLLQWFHDHGVPQVRQLRHEVLRPAEAQPSARRPTPAHPTL